MVQYTHRCIHISSDVEVPCKGLFDRKFEPLYDDGNAGATTARKLWIDSRKSGETYETPDGEQV